MFLIVIKGANIGSTFVLNKVGHIIIGRGEECDFRILDLMVSRKHCQIEKRDNKFYITDLNSTNRTKLNGKVIYGGRKIKIDDIIEIGNTALLFTDQKRISIKTVLDYDTIRKTKTRLLDFDLFLD